jgi:hypothetical protein
MGIISAFKKGFVRTHKAKGMVFFLFIVNIVISLIFFAPMYKSLNHSFGRRIIADKMLSGFDYTWFAQFNEKAEGLASSFLPGVINAGAFLENIQSLVKAGFIGQETIVLLLGILYLFISIFFAGGILKVFSSGEGRFSFALFFSGCGGYFLRFLRLFFISVIFFIPIYLLSYGLKLLVMLKLMDYGAEMPIFILNMAITALTFFLLFFIDMVFDYAKIRTVTKNSKKMFRDALRSFRFVFKNFGKTLSLYYLLGLTTVAIMAAYGFLIGFVHQTSLVSIIIGLILGLLFILGQVWMKVNFYSAQLSFYEGKS